MLLVTQIDTFYNGLTLWHRDTINAAVGGTFIKKRPEECYDLIKNMTVYHKHWDTSATRDETSRTISSTTTTESPECENCSGPHSFTECLAVSGYTQEAAYATTDNHNLWGNSYQPQVDYDVDPWVPLILWTPFVRTARALIDISGNPTPSDPIIASSSPSFTPFEGSDFILEEIETFLRTPDELSNLDVDYYDTEGDILYLQKLLNEDPSLNIPPVKNEDLMQADITMTKPSIEESSELKLKDLPSHLEYAFLEGTDKLPIIISKELKDEE
nr:reverse transcriptase domain-containing protein [Tanacetum cinerariifolium]